MQKYLVNEDEVKFKIGVGIFFHAERDLVHLQNSLFEKKAVKCHSQDNWIIIVTHTEKLYNVDEKGCWLTVYNQNTALAQRGARQVYLTAPEHVQNV